MAHTPPTGSHIETVSPEETPFVDNGFVGVSPEYQNFANDTDKPLEGDEEAEVAEDSTVDVDKNDDKGGETAKTGSTPSGTEASSASPTDTKKKTATPAI